MKRFLAIISAILVVIGRASASEEDFALIETLRIEAQTTVSTFGRVILTADVTSGMGSISDAKPKRISIAFNNDDHPIPDEVLEPIQSINFATLTISAEYGYPDHGIGPSLYLRFHGRKNETDYEFMAEFGKDGFLKLNEEASNKGLLRTGDPRTARPSAEP
jgi:hypothetical protein